MSNSFLGRGLQLGLASTLAGTTRYFAAVGSDVLITTEANAGLSQFSGTLSGMWINILSNIMGKQEVYTSRNSGAGNQTIIVPSNTTGIYQDVTHSDTLTTTSITDIQVVTAA